MTSKVTAFAVKWAAGEAVDNFAKKFDSEDPFYYDPQHLQEGQGDTEKQKKKGRQFKKYKGKNMYKPPGLEPEVRKDHAHDIKILASVRRRAWHLDMSLFHWCGFRFGWSVLIGLVPVLGDIIDCLLAYWIIRKADQIEGGLPQKVKNKMYINVAADFAIGLVPVLGDIADALYKANSRNTWLLEEYLVKKAEAEQAAAGGNLQARGPTDDPEQGILTAPKKTQKMQGTRP